MPPIQTEPMLFDSQAGKPCCDQRPAAIGEIQVKRLCWDTVHAGLTGIMSQEKGTDKADGRVTINRPARSLISRRPIRLSFCPALALTTGWCSMCYVSFEYSFRLPFFFKYVKTSSVITCLLIPLPTRFSRLVFHDQFPRPKNFVNFWSPSFQEIIHRSGERIIIFRSLYPRRLHPARP